MSRAAGAASRASLLHPDRDALDLHAESTRERGDADGRPRGPVVAEPFRVHLVHRREVGHVRQEHRRLHDVCEVGSGRGEHRGQVVDGAFGLGRHVTRDVRHRRGVDRALAGAVHEVPDRDRLAVRTDRLRRAVGRDGAQPHVVAHQSPYLDPRDKAAITASVSSLSCSGSTLRRSSTTRSSTMRAITGGSAARSAPTARAADAALSATPREGWVSSGSEPPPTVENVSTTAAAMPAPSSRPAIALARRPSFTGVALMSRHTGMVSTAVPSRYAATVATSAAIVSLSRRSARISGWLRSFAIAAGRP